MFKCNIKNLVSSLFVNSLIFMFILGCARKNELSAPATETLDQSNVPCSVGNCPKVDFGFQVQPMDGIGLVYTLVQPREWTVELKSPVNDRDLRLYAFNAPPEGSFDGLNTEKITINHNFKQETRNVRPMRFIARDVSRCIAYYPNETAKCSDLTALSTQLTPFEKEISIPWHVTAGDVVAYGDPTFLENDVPSFGKDGGTAGCIKGGLQGAAKGALKGSVFSAILGFAKDCVFTSVGNTL